jgi:hypothetical protein
VAAKGKDIGQNRDINIANRMFENMSVQYFGTTATIQNMIQEEI